MKRLFWLCRVELEASNESFARGAILVRRYFYYALWLSRPIDGRGR